MTTSAIAPVVDAVTADTLVMRYRSITMALNAHYDCVRKCTIAEAINECVDGEAQRALMRNDAINQITDKRVYNISQNACLAPIDEPDLILSSRKIIAERTAGRVWLTGIKSGHMKRLRRPMDTTTAGMVIAVWDSASNVSKDVIIRIIADKGSVIALKAMMAHHSRVK